MTDDAQAIHDKTATCVRHARLLMRDDSGAPLVMKEQSEELLNVPAKGNADPNQLYAHISLLPTFRIVMMTLLRDNSYGPPDITVVRTRVQTGYRSSARAKKIEGGSSPNY